MKTSIIPIFIPHIGCPHRCVFCNQHKITGRTGVPDGPFVAGTIKAYVESAGDRRRWEIAFYGGSFTAVPARLQEELLAPAYEALRRGDAAALRCSTRPDCIDEAVLKRLRRYGMTIVELGVQSMDDDVLARARRGHTAAQTAAATALLKAEGFTVGHQLMPGLPGEDWPSLQATTEAVCRLKPDMARIYPVVVIDDTELADMYRAGLYEALTVEEGVRRAAYMKEAFLKHGIACIRTGLQATADLDDPSQVLAGAYAPAMGEMVDTVRYRKGLFRLLDGADPAGDITVSYNRRDTSRVRGYGGTTAGKAEARYGPRFSWREDPSLPQGTIAVAAGGAVWRLSVDSGKVTKG